VDDSSEVRSQTPKPASDGHAVFIGCVSGCLSGILLGVVIAGTTGPLLSVTSLIIIFHASLAMLAMGAWAAPAIMSDPDAEEGATRAQPARMPIASQRVEREPAAPSGRQAMEAPTTTAT
jgi:hypothetical protein